MDKFSVRLKAEREKRGYSQNDLANALNISRQSISKWERQVGYPNIETLIEISNLFELTIDELLKGDYHLEEKIIQDGKHLKYPRLKMFFDLLLIIGIVAVAIGILAVLFFTPIGLIPLINGLVIGLIGWIGIFFTAKKYA